MKLIGKIFIEGKLKTLTGLNIGGSKTDVVIGGLDNNVIKTPEGVPYIPGSSIKGKLRSLLEKKEGKNICDCGNCSICAIFGVGGNIESEVGSTRLYVRDSYLNIETKRQMEMKEGSFKDLELTYTEVKWENVIDRVTSKADHPRPTERVPADSYFDVYMVFNVFNDSTDIDRFNELVTSLKMLEDDYLGSSGSRGYGRVEFETLAINVKSTKDYELNNKPHNLFTGQLDNINFQQLKKQIQEILGVE